MAKSPLQVELGKRDPFESIEQEVALNLSRTSDRIHLRFVRLFRDQGLTATQYNILRILRGEGKPLPSLEIAARTVTEVPGMTGLIDRLEQAGFVTRIRCLEDRRVIRIAISEAGTAMLEKLDAPVIELHRELLQHMSPEELTMLNVLLVKARRFGEASK